MTDSIGIDRLLALMAALRTPGTGCPWDLEQTSASIARYAIEEAYEVVDAIERGDHGDVRDELGDLLLQVVFHACIAEEAGRFTFADVVATLSAKLIRRHPHVFDGADALSSAGVRESWETIKAEERRRKPSQSNVVPSIFAGVPITLPGLTRGLKLQEKAARVGFDWNDATTVCAKIREEVDEVMAAMAGGTPDEVADEIGDILFAATNLARHAGVDPEAAVRRTNAKFERRFAFIEARLAARGSSPEAASLADMDALWDEAKAQGL